MKGTAKTSLVQAGTVEVPAVIVGDLAVHRPTSDGVAFDQTQWTISHLPSGWTIASLFREQLKRQGDAVQFAAAIQERCPDDWAKLKNGVRFGGRSQPKAITPALRRIKEAAREIHLAARN